MAGNRPLAYNAPRGDTVVPLPPPTRWVHVTRRAGVAPVQITAHSQDDPPIPAAYREGTFGGEARRLYQALVETLPAETLAHLRAEFVARDLPF